MQHVVTDSNCFSFWNAKISLHAQQQWHRGVIASVNRSLLSEPMRLLVRQWLQTQVKPLCQYHSNMLTMTALTCLPRSSSRFSSLASKQLISTKLALMWGLGKLTFWSNDNTGKVKEIIKVMTIHPEGCITVFLTKFHNNPSNFCWGISACGGVSALTLSVKVTDHHHQ